jgi:hypothetical protein
MELLERRMTWALMTGAMGAAVVAAALLAGVGLFPIEPVAADDCAARCRSAYNQCRIETKGSSACEGRFTSCMQGCRRK